MRALTGDPRTLPSPAPSAVPRLWAGLSRGSKRLILGGAALLLMMVAAVSFTMWDLRVEARDDIRRNLSKLGIAISEQTTRSIQSVDLALTDIIRQVSEAGIDTPARFNAELRTAELHANLHLKDQALPQANAFTIIGADGNLVNFSRQWPVPVTNLSDRDYYTYFRDHDDRQLYISAPVQNRGNGEWTAYAVRRVSGPNGEFLGMVLGALDLGYFRDFYQALTVGADTTVTLLRRDGTVLTSFPTTAPIGARLPAASAWFGMVARGVADTFMTPGVLAPGNRIVSVNPIHDYPLVVNVSLSEADSLANWRKAAVMVGFGTLSAVLCVFFLLRAVLLQLQGLERSEASLARQNVWLETTRYRMESQAAELQASRASLAEKSAELETTLDHMNQGIMMVRRDRRVAVFNKRVMQMLDLPAALMNGHPTFDEVVAHQHSIAEFVGNDPSSRVGRAEVAGAPLVYERKRPDGRILEIQSVPLASGGMVRTYTDVTERRLSEDKVRYFAHHDDLTKLVNRLVFQERLAHAIELSDRSERSIAVLYLDLDGFKQINDTLGHAMGDRLLVQVAERLRGTVRDIDTVARMGGDEFAIIQPLVEHPDSSAALARRVLDAINAPFDIDGTKCAVGVSIGIAHYPDHASNASDLLRNTDTALYRAKADGRGVYRIFDEAMDTRQQQLFLLERELRDAVELNQFELEYQPIVDIESRLPVCCEALLRWRHPRRGLMGPVDFIELAENARLIVPIGLWVLETALAEAAAWPASILLAVNLSPAQFNHERLIDDLVAIQARTGFELSRLILEVTEGLLLEESGTVLGTMSRLHGLGVKFSLDDFGTAHAGLSYLRRFPFDIIKIDKSFVQDTVEEPEARAIVAGILGIGAALRLRVIAEGVETEAQLAQIRQLQGKYVQGFLTGRPVTASAIRRMIAEAPERCDDHPGLDGPM